MPRATYTLQYSFIPSVPPVAYFTELVSCHPVREVCESYCVENVIRKVKRGKGRRQRQTGWEARMGIAPHRMAIRGHGKQAMASFNSFPVL